MEISSTATDAGEKRRAEPGVKKKRSQLRREMQSPIKAQVPLRASVGRRYKKAGQRECWREGEFPPNGMASTPRKSTTKKKKMKLTIE